ncbi:gametocyte-specific factor 1-like [Acanthochromis polyacanthus]|uniref:Gametocyte-specific factor 1-like n=1 Tax=Acanthochromis polyacanthus TaxID=80966 RepID=A0A3Q1GSM0_9TELE|nr:gametocyte-specific factor 1-like [Acanthochromis polyacanthus]XP_051809202.1 gametocyte-specific factor 1-like [Acanthochromis polyacanthus]
MATYRFGTPSSPSRMASAGRAHPAEESDVTDDGDPNRLLQCPFDEHHKIRASRFPFHIIKCRKNHPKLASELKTCPFNARHLVPKHELAHHTETCENRPSEDSQAAGSSNEPQWHVPVSTRVNPNMTEDWEEEVDNDAVPFVWGADMTFTKEQKSKASKTLSPRAPNTRPWDNKQ